MRRSVNFGSIFRRKEDLRPAQSSEQAEVLSKVLAERMITFKEGDLKPMSPEIPALDWTTVGGQITVQGAAIEGLLEGRARIRAQQLKNLTPSPIASETPDSTEYEVSLAAVVPQIQDLLGSSQSEATGQPEYETPFTVLAREDNARFANGIDRQQEGQENPPELQAEARDSENHQTQRPEAKTPQGKQGGPTTSNETPLVEAERFAPGSSKVFSVPINQFRSQADKDQPTSDNPSGVHHLPQGRRSEEELARRGLERLQEIFMLSEPLDARRVAFLLRQFPGVTGALILLDGGAVLGGELPDCLSMEAALQGPEVLRKFIRFIVELEPGRTAQTRFITVTSATTISFIHSGQIVLVVSHQSRKLPPGLAQRLTETAEALNLIYGNSCP
jgi:hypothetical protein